MPGRPVRQELVYWSGKLGKPQLVCRRSQLVLLEEHLEDPTGVIKHGLIIENYSVGIRAVAGPDGEQLMDDEEELVLDLACLLEKKDARPLDTGVKRILTTARLNMLLDKREESGASGWGRRDWADRALAWKGGHSVYHYHLKTYSVRRLLNGGRDLSISAAAGNGAVSTRKFGGRLWGPGAGIIATGIVATGGDSSCTSGVSESRPKWTNRASVKDSAAADGPMFCASGSEANLDLGLSSDKAGLGSSLGAGDGRTACTGLLEERICG